MLHDLAKLLGTGREAYARDKNRKTKIFEKE